MEVNKNYKCHIVKDFPKPFCPEATPYDQTDFPDPVKNFCLQVSALMTGLRMCKLIVLGDVNVGKTSIVNRFCRQIFNFHYKATIGVDFEMEKFEILNVPFNMQIWDTAGQERFRCIASSYYRRAHAIITVFDLTNIKSLRHCLLWVNEALGSTNEIPLKFLVGTKMDLVSEINYEKIKTDALKVAKLIRGEYWAVSARTGEHISDLFHRIAALSFSKAVESELESPETIKQIVLSDELNKPEVSKSIIRKNYSKQKGCNFENKDCLIA